MAKKKTYRTKAENAHIQKLVDYGCIVCRNEMNVYTAPTIHHMRAGQGTGQRAPWSRTLPLCHVHHQDGGHGVALHAGQKTWEQKYGTEEELLGQLYNDLNISG
ncbi:DUF968 domain-containing protein [Salmonella enterica subsp. enterica]|nr:DUF968 domain-containing protein [Salmonella enterica subsp. enterica]